MIGHKFINLYLQKHCSHTKNSHIMKPNHLFSSMLVVTAIAVASCSAPKMAQKTSSDDDVYGTTAQAVEYSRPEAVQSSQVYDDYQDDDEYYGSSDLYADMSYSSRINRFYYGSPYRGYYDPFYFDSFYGGGFSPYYGGFGMGYGYGGYGGFGGWGGGYGGWGLGLGFGYGYGGWGGFYSPFYSPWGFGGYGGYYGGLWGGGFYGGGYYGGLWGGGYGRSSNYRPRTGRGGENMTYGRGNYNGTGSTRYGTNGSVLNGRRSSGYTGGRGNNSGYNPSRTVRSREVQSTRPSRTESYSPPMNSGSRGSSGGFGGGGGRSSGGGGGGRGGRGN